MINKINIKKTALVSALLLELGIGGAHAADINVDGDICTLADAITAANTNQAVGGCIAGDDNPYDLITLAANKEFILNQALPSIESIVYIQGNGSTIKRAANAPEFGILRMNTPGSGLWLNDLTITGGHRSDNQGGGIGVIQGSLILTNSIVTGNTGGGVFIKQTPYSHIVNSKITENIANPNYDLYSSGISVVSSYLYIEYSTIDGNSTANTVGGAGIYGKNSHIYLNYSTVSNNTAVAGGGGIAHIGNGNQAYYLNVSNSTISGNTSTGGSGGGITIQQSVGVIVLSTIVLNHSNNQGGGIDFNSDISYLIASIVSGNTIDGDGGNEAHATDGLVVSQLNVFGVYSVPGVIGLYNNLTSIVNPGDLSTVVSPTLANNGGFTMTHLPNVNGPAIDSITEECTGFDQTGRQRPQDGDNDGFAYCDIGAVELPTDLIFYDGFE